VLLVLPGITYALARSLVRGFRPADGTVATRVFEASVVSTVLWLFLLALLGEELMTLMRNSATPPYSEARSAAAVVLAVCAVAAVLGVARHGDFRWERKWPFLRPRLNYRSDPTAWDRAAPRSGGFVRIKRSAHEWYGGHLGSRSYVSTYPQERDIFIEKPYKLSKYGEFRSKIESGTGLWMKVLDTDVVEWLEEGEEVKFGDEEDGRARVVRRRRYSHDDADWSP
jgi:hypothetical protein